MIKRLWLLLALLLLSIPAQADTARDVTSRCTFTANYNAKQLSFLTDGNYETAFVAGRTKNKETPCLRIDAPKGETIAALYVSFSKKLVNMQLETLCEDGTWQVVHHYDGKQFYNDYQTFAPAKAVRLTQPVVKDNAYFAVSELHALTQGDAPDSVQRWKRLEGKADLMVVVAHPDDEYLWFGGAIPYYQMVRGKTVLVVYMRSIDAHRRCEMLDGLWHCGVRVYPVYYQYNAAQLKNSGTETLATLARKHRPDVVLSHGLRGEYGAKMHILTANAVRALASKAANKYYKDGNKPWQIKKVYLHSLQTGRIEMDWETPYDALGGKTSRQVATEAFQMHVSQVSALGYGMDDTARNEFNFHYFGLAFSAVGEDKAGGDFFENIDP